jgi:hypothetical protein
MYRTVLPSCTPLIFGPHITPHCPAPSWWTGPHIALIAAAVTLGALLLGTAALRRRCCGGNAIWFDGDLVRATVDGWPVSGVIKDFTYDLADIGPGDVANVVIVRPSGPHETGQMAAIPAGELTAGWD